MTAKLTAAVLEIRGAGDSRPPSIRFQESDYVEGDLVDAEDLIASSNALPYGFDDQHRRVILVETSSDTDLSEAPFLAEGQYEHAVRLYAIPYETCNRLADGLPDPEHLIFIYSTGRCGSTLLHHVFNAAVGVTGLSEPNIYAQAAAMRGFHNERRTEMQELVRSTTRLLCRGPSPTWTIKLHAQIIEIADMMQAALPGSTAIFLYRNADPTLRSFIAAFMADYDSYGLSPEKIEFSSRQIRDWSRHMSYLEAYIDDPASLSLSNFIAAYWLSPMQKYLELHPTGIWRCAVRYERLTEDPQRIISELFQRCNVSTSQMDRVLRVLERDSQQGTRISQENVGKRASDNEYLGNDFLAEIHSHVEAHPDIGATDFILPGTLR